MGVITVVDSEGEPMRHAVRAEPEVISPNVVEAEELVGHEFNDEKDRVIAVDQMVQLGAGEAIMTLPDGCVASLKVDGDRALHRVWIEPRESAAAVGAGDAFLAGYVAARYTGQKPEECLRRAVACGAESTGRLGAGLVDPRRGRALLIEIEVQRLDCPAGVVLITLSSKGRGRLPPARRLAVPRTPPARGLFVRPRT